MSIIRFNDDKEPHAYIVRKSMFSEEIEVHRISGDIESWSGDTFETEAEAYLTGYVFLRKKQLDEMHKYECKMMRKGIEGYPSNGVVFEKFYPNLQKQYAKERLEQAQIGIKERKNK